MNPITRSRRPGSAAFALLAVLWVMAGATSLALLALLAAREAIATARDRTDEIRSMWIAEECMEHARDAIAARLAGGDAMPAHDAAGNWSQLDETRLPTRSSSGACDVDLIAAGSRIDVNAADRVLMIGAVSQLGASSQVADSLVDALLDWRDDDNIPRPHGAESEWYRAARRHAPRNGPLTTAAELHRVRGFDRFPGSAEIFDVEPGRISLRHAPPTVLAALPGLTAEAVVRLAHNQTSNAAFSDLREIAATFSSPAQEEMMLAYPELARLTTVEPDAWIVRSVSRARVSQGAFVLELRLVRAGDRAAVVRRREWRE